MSRVEYFNLAIPAPRRLAMMRADHSTHAARYPHCPESAKPRDWRAVRAYGHHSWEGAFATLDQGMQGKTPIWYTHAGPEFRDERETPDILQRAHGYYTNSDASETAVGIVACLPHGRFLAGYLWNSNGERVYFPDVFDDEIDAARMADEHARVFAESAREDSERFDAMQDAERVAGDAAAEVRSAWRTYKTARVAWLTDSERFGPALDSARESVAEALQALRDAREELDQATKDYERG